MNDEEENEDDVKSPFEDDDEEKEPSPDDEDIDDDDEDKEPSNEEGEEPSTEESPDKPEGEASPAEDLHVDDLRSDSPPVSPRTGDTKKIGFFENPNKPKIETKAKDASFFSDAED